MMTLKIEFSVARGYLSRAFETWLSKRGFKVTGVGTGSVEFEGPLEIEGVPLNEKKISLRQKTVILRRQTQVAINAFRAEVETEFGLVTGGAMVFLPL